jgi:RNA polymerase sigma-70 factor, ECF subfamily
MMRASASRLRLESHPSSESEGRRTGTEALFERLYPSLFRYLHRLTGDADVAEDAAQEAFVRFLDRSIPEAEARAWLFTVALNLVRDVSRRSTHRRALLSVTPVLPSTPPAPDEVVERSERIERVRRALESVPERDRQLLLMREEGFSYQEISEVVGVAPSSVGTLISRALRRFAQVYGDPESETNDGPSR